MNQLITVIRQTRENFIRLIESSSVEELNYIPHGFNNNMIWNFGHIAASQQVLCYLSANAEPAAAPEFIGQFRKGTKPERIIGAEEVNAIKELMRSSIDQMLKDLESDKFENYKAFTTHYGVELKNVSDAIQFFSVHDSFHYGFAAAIKRIINNNK